MNTTPAVPFMQKAMNFHPAISSVATSATGLIRQMAIKPYTPRTRRREFLLRERIASLHAIRNPIFKEKGAGDIPTIVVGGFVPDATEAVEFQRPLFKNYGSIYYLNFARNGFSLEMFFAQLADLIEDINTRGKKPVIFSISFGCGLVSAFLESKANDPSLRIRGVVMASPVLCTADLVREEREKGSGGVRMLESNLKRIMKADGTEESDVSRQIERARRCFQSLFEAGAENRTMNRRHLSIKKRIMDVVEKTPAMGGYQRVLALGEFSAPTEERPIFAGPALALLAEQEDNILVPSSPTLKLLKDPAARAGLFPRGKVKTVISRVAGDAVAHASLIFHQHCYNPLIEAWYDQLLAPRLFAVV
ncbi:MAG TPA: alpha/beta hydrolase [Geobacteraceae bacterium]|nr:alpha/beta hydrolase [Geobacteraceae bacterium]